METYNCKSLKVSVITPTTEDRFDFNERIKRLVEFQDYKPIEHVMLYGEGSIGKKRNQCIEIATGDVIFMIDSDDMIAPDFVSKSLNFLLSSNADVVGLSSAYFTDGVNCWLYEWKGGQPLVIGSSMMFWRRAWENNHFKDTSHGEDTIFCANAGIIKPHGYLDGFIATIHGENTSSHNSLKAMKMVNPNLLPMLDQQAFQ